MTKIIDPYGSELVSDYQKIVSEFGLQSFDPAVFPQPNRLMRRRIVFAGRDLERISKSIKEKKPFYVLSGIMPTAERIHFGTKMVVENIKYFQEHGGIAYILIADLEATAARDVTLQEAKKRAMEFHIPAYIALGLDPKKTTFYFQSENKKVIHMAYEFSRKVTLNEFKAVYGNADPGRIISALTQIGDILFPQTEMRMPGIIPVGVDQDPHIRLSRDVVNRTRRKKFFAPSSIYHKFTPSLDGSLKMSKSKPESCLELPEDPKSACKKIKRALTGGRDTLEEHRRLGADIKKDMVFELLKQHLIEDDDELDRIFDEYSSGNMTSAEIKKVACERMTRFMEDFSRKLESNRKKVDSLNFVRFD